MSGENKGIFERDVERRGNPSDSSTSDSGEDIEELGGRSEGSANLSLKKANPLASFDGIESTRPRDALAFNSDELREIFNDLAREEKRIHGNKDWPLPNRPKDSFDPRRDGPA